MTSFISRINGEEQIYRIEFETTYRDDFILMEKLARLIIDWRAQEKAKENGK